MKLLVITTCLAGLAIKAYAAPGPPPVLHSSASFTTVSHPSATPMPTILVTSIHRPIVKSTLYGTFPHMQWRCCPSCAHSAPAGECIQTVIDGYAWQETVQQDSGLSRVSAEERCVAVVAAAAIAAVDWRLSVLVLFGSGVLRRLGAGVGAAAALTAAGKEGRSLTASSTRSKFVGTDGVALAGTCSPVCVQVDMHGQCIKMIPNCVREESGAQVVGAGGAGSVAVLIATVLAVLQMGRKG